MPPRPSSRCTTYRSARVNGNVSIAVEGPEDWPFPGVAPEPASLTRGAVRGGMSALGDRTRSDMGHPLDSSPHHPASEHWRSSSLATVTSAGQATDCGPAALTSLLGGFGMSGRRLHHFRHDQSPPEPHAVTVNQSTRAR